ncbi:MAG: hypothetical protein WA783_14265 [Phormidesmis sp.]
MFTPTLQGAFASTSFNASEPPAQRPVAQAEPVRHTLCGSLAAVQSTIKLLYKLNYAAPTDWSQPQPTGRPSEFISVLQRRAII